MKKYITFSVFILFLVSLAAQNRPMQRPALLHPGDKVAIISPASRPDKSFVEGGEKVLRDWGYVPVRGKHVLDRSGSYAGTVDARYEDLMWALRDPEIKAVICSRGGYGSVKELERIPLDTLARYPKWMIGYSDITAIHSALVNAGVMSIHAHMCEYLRDFKGVDSCSRALRNILAGGVPEYRIPVHEYNREGICSGRLVGGNMAVFSGLAGSRMDFLLNDDIVLFVEDVSESIGSIDRMVHLLKVRGILPRLKGLIIGRFTDYKPDEDYTDMYRMLHNALKDCDFPVAFGFPVGHVDDNYPLIEGAQVTLTVDKNETRLQFSN